MTETISMAVLAAALNQVTAERDRLAQELADLQVPTPDRADLQNALEGTLALIQRTGGYLAPEDLQALRHWRAVLEGSK